MISNINGGAHIVVTNGNSTGPYLGNYSNHSMVGMVRYHNGSLETYDGNMWMRLSSAPVNIDLSGSANGAINWALQKMAEEAELQRLSDQNPAVKAAYENMKRAAEQLKTTIILSKDENTTS
jgi:hypothetical protein